MMSQMNAVTQGPPSAVDVREPSHDRDPELDSDPWSLKVILTLGKIISH